MDYFGLLRALDSFTPVHVSQVPPLDLLVPVEIRTLAERGGHPGPAFRVLLTARRHRSYSPNGGSQGLVQASFLVSHVQLQFPHSGRHGWHSTRGYKLVHANHKSGDRMPETGARSRIDVHVPNARVMI